MSSEFNVNAAFNSIMQAIQSRESELSASMSKLQEGNKEISDQDMLKLQFQVNQYNVFLETASTITKALTDQAKQLAQRSN
ncbi:MAG: hypothetical protein IIV95_06635 [Burkholderiaceae bacterium]|jgi:type III secretion apparatus needle protein|nr:hypothetical protein [Burkholderiaceae bacterium]